MEPTIEVKVVMLPTKESRLVNHIPSGLLAYSAGDKCSELTTQQPQHLYFTSMSEKIKEGDWSYCSIPNCTRERVIKVTDDWNLDSLNRFRKEGYESKIVASTDPSLNLPSIPESFIQHYIKANGKIESVKLLQQEWCGCGHKAEELVHKFSCTTTKPFYGLKVTDENEVIVVEEPTTLSDVVEELVLGWEAGDVQVKIDGKLVEKEPEHAAKAAFVASLDRILEGKLTIKRRDDYRWGFYDGWKANPNKWTTEQVLQAIKYGFEYHRDSMNDNVDVPEGNKLQWLLGTFISPEEHGEWLEEYKKNQNPA